MTDLDRHVQEYLKLRRALGFKLQRDGEVLPQFVAYLEAAGSATLTAELAISWARLPEGVQPIQWAQRLASVRGFARYLQTIDPATEVPARDVFGARRTRPTPYLWSEDEVLRLMEAPREIKPALAGAHPRSALRVLVCLGDADRRGDRLVRDDVDLASGVITVRRGKVRPLGSCHCSRA